MESSRTGTILHMLERRKIEVFGWIEATDKELEIFSERLEEDEAIDVC